VGRLKWRGARGTLVLHFLDGRGGLAGVAKVPLEEAGGEARIEREHEQLRRLATAASAAGVATPASRIARQRGGWPALLEAPLPGRPAAALIAEGALDLETVTRRLAGWLERWSRSTLSRGLVDRAWIDRHLAAPLRAVGPELPEGSDYARALAARGEALLGRPLPRVAAHGDLTMSNIVIEGTGAWGVVDWEEASAEGLPLADFRYGVVDAAAAASRGRDRRAAFIRCFAVGQPQAELVRRYEARLRTAVGLDEEVDALCFHACWLRHAADEQRKRDAGRPRPFLSIVRWIAERRPGLGSVAGEAAPTP
jgi:hypothetical protein